jgi:hypothetical protein
MLSGVWDRVSGYQFDSSTVLVVLTGVAGFAAVAVDRVWHRTRNVITIVHEAAHAVVAVLTGRRLTGIRLHSDTSGLTLSVGKPDGPGMVATAAAGYLSAPLLGLCGVAVLAAGWVTVTLWVIVGLLLAMLVMIRTGYGVLAVLLTGALVGLVAWYAPAGAQAAFGHVATWFLLAGGVRPIFELQRLRRAGAARQSDVDQLARLTGAPALLWVALFGLVSLAALAGGGWLLLH